MGPTGPFLLSFFSILLLPVFTAAQFPSFSGLPAPSSSVPSFPTGIIVAFVLAPFFFLALVATLIAVCARRGLWGWGPWAGWPWWGGPNRNVVVLTQPSVTTVQPAVQGWATPPVLTPMAVQYGQQYGHQYSQQPYYTNQPQWVQYV